jgi:hypothetical protein
MQCVQIRLPYIDRFEAINCLLDEVLLLHGFFFARIRQFSSGLVSQFILSFTILILLLVSPGDVMSTAASITCLIFEDRKTLLVENST